MAEEQERVERSRANSRESFPTETLNPFATRSGGNSRTSEAAISLPGAPPGSSKGTQKRTSMTSNNGGFHQLRLETNQDPGGSRESVVNGPNRFSRRSVDDGNRVTPPSYNLSVAKAIPEERLEPNADEKISSFAAFLQKREAGRDRVPGLRTRALSDEEGDRRAPQVPLGSERSGTFKDLPTVSRRDEGASVASVPPALASSMSRMRGLSAEADELADDSVRNRRRQLRINTDLDSVDGGDMIRSSAFRRMTGRALSRPVADDVHVSGAEELREIINPYISSLEVSKRVF